MTLSSPIGVPVQVWATLLPTDVPVKTVDGPSTWDTTTNMGDMNGVPGSWVLLGPAQTVCGPLGSVPIDRISLFLPLSLCNSLCLSNKLLNLKKQTKKELKGYPMQLLHTEF